MILTSMTNGSEYSVTAEREQIRSKDMTREEAIAYGKRVIDLGLNDETQAFCELAIKALKQEPILDKIRAEIERQEKWLLQAEYNTYNVDIAFDAIKSIVAESEAEDANN